MSDSESYEDQKITIEDNYNCHGKLVASRDELINGDPCNLKEDIDVEETENDAIISPCVFCEFTTASSDEMIDHLKNYHELNLIDEASKTTNIEENHRHNNRTIAETSGTSSSVFMVGNKKYHQPIRRGLNGGYVYDCGSCDFTTTVREQWVGHFKYHERTLHVEKDVFPCPFCPLTEKKSKTMNDHILKVHLETEKKVFNCTMCDYSSNIKSSVESHMNRIHYKMKFEKRPRSYVKNFLCDFCEFKSRSRNSLAIHVKAIHLKIKDFSCNICEYKASSRMSLNRHIKTVHLEIRNFSCTFCEFKSFVKKTLEDHVRVVHLNTTKYKCDKCDYGSNAKAALDEHVTTVHLKIKKAKCPQCDYTTARKENLRYHIDSVHLKKKDHKCHLCDYATCKSYNLQNHIKIVHLNEKKMKCRKKSCKYATFFETKLKVHMMKMHQIVE